MYNSFIFQQYVCHTTLLNMFRAAPRSSSGGPIVSPQPLVSSPSVSSRTAYCTAAYRGWRNQRLWWYNWSFWWWAACCSKHVEERSVTYILLKNKWVVHYNPQHVSSSALLIFRRTYCIITASGIVTLCKRPWSMPVESDDTRGCGETIGPPACCSKHVEERSVTYILLKNKWVVH